MSETKVPLIKNIVNCSTLIVVSKTVAIGKATS